MIIVIDGPSGSGKSSTARAVAELLDIQYLDSGALYRAVTLVWLEEKRPQEEFLDILLSKSIRFEYSKNRFRVWIDTLEVSDEIRRAYVSDHVSQVAAMSFVRNYVNELMRSVVREADFIADGRDLGSAVFPDADLKFYLDASLDVRARRRYHELRAGGELVSFEEVKENLRMRDQADRSRKLDPLTKAEGAYSIDNSEKTFDEQVDEICRIIQDNTTLSHNP